MIAFFMIVVSSIAVGLVMQYYEGAFLKIEMLGYTVVLSAPVTFLLCCLLVLCFLMLLRIFAYCAFSINRLKLRLMEKKLLLLGEGYAYLSLKDVQQACGVVSKLGEFDSDSLVLLRGCTCFKLGQYEVAIERHFVSLAGKSMVSNRVGLWLLQVLNQEQSRDCKLRVLRRLSEVFRERWSCIFRVESFLMESAWHLVLSELKFARKFNIVVQYDIGRLEAIARYALASADYEGRKYKRALRWIENREDLFIVLLKARCYVKLNRIRNALSTLESRYRVNQHFEIFEAYLEISKNRNAAINRLCNLSPTHYVSVFWNIKRLLDLKQYDIAEQHIRNAFSQYQYVSLYRLMLEMAAAMGDSDKVLYWLGRMECDAVPDMCWKCVKCHATAARWHHECAACKAFDTVKWVS